MAEITGYRHMLVALSLASGKVKLHLYLDAPTKSNQPAYNQQRPGLVIWHGRVYASFGGLSGDCGPYQGSVVSAPLTGTGPLARWTTPTRREGAIWATRGPGRRARRTPVDFRRQRRDGIWSRLGRQRLGDRAHPGAEAPGYFAPAIWPSDNAHDLDLGSTQPVLAAGDSTLIVGKRAIGYLLNTTHLGGIGGQLAQAPVCKVRGAAAVKRFRRVRAVR